MKLYDTVAYQNDVVYGQIVQETRVDYAAEGVSPRRVTAVIAVILLHVLIIYVLLSGLGSEVYKVLRHPVEVKLIEHVRPPRIHRPPPPPPQLLRPPPPYIPIPLVHIAVPVRHPVIATVTHTKPRTPHHAPIPAVERPAGLAPNQTCAPPAYPESAEEMRQTGQTVLQFLINAEGNVIDARIARTSGFHILDNAAEHALSKCKFKPAIGAGGKPEEAWTSIEYNWKLN